MQLHNKNTIQEATFPVHQRIFAITIHSISTIFEQPCFSVKGGGGGGLNSLR
uniref:Uncharacterized protein n=1 Tax=Ascaris lumbricoides TaxID=6252 RepID=A0A0M3IJS5_ASCLU